VRNAVVAARLANEQRVQVAVLTLDVSKQIVEIRLCEFLAGALKNRVADAVNKAPGIK
jgi:hypothetical protein